MMYTAIENSKLILYETYYKTKDIKSLLNKCADILDNPILLASKSYRVIHSVNKTNILIDDETWSFAEKYGYFASDSIRSFKEAGFTTAVHQHDKPVLIDYDICTDIPRAVHRVVADNKTVAYLGVLQLNRTISEKDMVLIETIGDILSVALKAEKYNIIEFQDSIQDELIMDVLEERIHTKDLLYERMYSANWNVQKYFKLLIVPLTTSDGSIHYNSYLMRKIQEKVASSKIVTYKNTLIIILNANKIDHLKEATAQIKEIMVTNGLYTISSRIFENVLFLPKIFKHLREISAHLNITKARHQPIIHQDQYLAESIIHKAGIHDNLEHYIVNAYHTLNQHDYLNGTEYVLTLKKFLEHACNVTKTAEALFIHRNSVRMRLKLIENLIGPIDNGQLLFDIYLSDKLNTWNMAASRFPY